MEVQSDGHVPFSNAAEGEIDNPPPYFHPVGPKLPVRFYLFFLREAKLPVR
jgi:hypothetical protein